MKTPEMRGVPSSKRFYSLASAWLDNRLRAPVIRKSE